MCRMAGYGCKAEVDVALVETPNSGVQFKYRMFPHDYEQNIAHNHNTAPLPSHQLAPTRVARAQYSTYFLICRPGQAIEFKKMPYDCQLL